MKRKTIKYIVAAMAASMALTASGGSTTSSDSGTTTAAAESASAGSAGAETTTAASGTDSATISVADPNASYKDTLNIAVAQQAPSLDLHKNSSLIARQMMDGTCWENSWDYLAVINFGHYIANYAWNDHVKGLNNYSGLYFWNAGYVE